MTNALLGNGRLNNFRLNALDQSLVQIRRTKCRILLNGVDVRERVRVGSLTVRDALNDAPNTAAFTIEAPPSVPYAPAVLADSPLAYWRLGDVGTTALDQTGRGHTGTVVGAVAINQPGAVNDGDRAMYFPGSVGSRVEVATAADLALSGGVSVEAWVKTDSAAQVGGIVQRTVGGVLNTGYGLMQSNATWLFQIVFAGGALSNVTAPVEAADVGQWVHLVGGWHPAYNLMWLFKNGREVGQISVPTGALGTAGPLYIGHLGSNQYPFAGAIDEVAIYSLLFSTVNAHYLAGRPPAGATIGQDLRVSVSVDDPVLLFNGTLSQVDLTYEGRAHTPIYHCAATDDTARASRRRPFGQWTNVSATVIAKALITSFVPGFGSTFVQANLPAITVVFDGSEGLNRCLTQITNLIGGYWYFVDRQLHLFLTEPTSSPNPIDGAHAFLADPRIATSVEMSQVRTRVFGRGHGEALLSIVLAGETLIPIADAGMFSPSGGHGIALAQVLTYTGIYLGGSGSLIGPGAGPSVALVATLQSGAGLGIGLYTYAYTDVTAAGESLSGPLAMVTTGPTPAPTTAPALVAMGAGPGPDPGAHQYAVTFLTSTGETTPGPSALITTGVLASPGVAPTAKAGPGNGVDPGPHDYAVTFITATGQTTPGPISVPVTAVFIPNPSAVPVLTPLGGNWPYGTTFTALLAFQWVGTINGVQTSIGPWTSVPMAPGSVYKFTVSGVAPNDPNIARVNVQQSLDDGAHWGAFGNSPTLSPGQPFAFEVWISPNGTTTPAPLNVRACALAVSGIPTGDATVTSRGLYRRTVGTFKLVVVIPNNTATTYADTVPEASLGVNAPSVNTAAIQQLTITVPTGDARVTGRAIYRTVVGGSQLKRAVMIADNVTTLWTDTLSDAALGATAPSVSTATASRVQLSAIAVGPATVTARRVYRTVANGAQLKLLTTLADNTTLTYLDALADAALGANLPVGDTSGLTQAQGQVNAGSSTLPTASAGPFLPAGWAIIGTQVIRYTGIAGNSLTGIPASGPGALVATVRYGDHILAAPMLTGVTVPGNVLTAPAGSVIYLWVQRDDAAAQAVMAQYDGGDGIYEYLVQDERRGEPSMTALCDAHLLAYKAPLQTVNYATRDLQTKSGKAIVVNLVTPPMHANLVIQDVTIDQIDTVPGVAPRFVVTASTVRFSLEDLLRQLAGSLEVEPA